MTWGEDAEPLEAREAPSYHSCLHRNRTQGRPPLTLQLSSNRRQGEVGQVLAGWGGCWPWPDGACGVPEPVPAGDRSCTEAEPKMRSEGGGRRHQECSHMPRAKQTALPSASNHWCAAGTPCGGLGQMTLVLDSRPEPFHPSMKRTIVSEGQKAPKDHCVVESS